MRACECGSPWGPGWDHWVYCDRWPGSQWARRLGYQGNCEGLTQCRRVHEYEREEYCDCRGGCRTCAHIGCARCLDGIGFKQWAQRMWRHRRRSRSE